MFTHRVMREPEPEVAPREAAPSPMAVAACICGHPIDDHDAVGRRYCAATVAAVLPRGCICAAVPAHHRR